MRNSLASRLATLYALMLSVIVIVVILASSVALVFKLGALTGDIVISKHEEARSLADQYRASGKSLKQAAPMIVQQLSGIGLRIAIYDSTGRFLAGDRELRPRFLSQLTARQGPGSASGISSTLLNAVVPKRMKSTQIYIYNSPAGLFGLPVSTADGKPSTFSAFPLAMQTPRARRPTSVSQLVLHEILPRTNSAREEPRDLAMINGGFVAFAASWALITVALVPYWKFIITIGVLAVALSWLLGWQFSKQALRPLQDVTDALRALAQGEYAQQRFVLASGDEMAALTAAYNDAAANVSASMDERRRTEERMRQFVADAGHELRTPLTVIAGYIDVLRRGAVQEPTVAKQILNTMAIEKEHMRALIDRLMRLARLDAETPPVNAPFSVADLLRKQVDTAHRLDPGLAIDYSVDGASEIVADRSEISEALWNIVENAIKYAPAAPIHLSAFRDNGKTAIVVRDEGPGMTDSERHHAFERFYRGDVRGEISGSGLGLAIAKRAIERAGGDITIDSTPGHGTSVTVKV
ncbi:MAG: HAMP domain-containing histidine kinase [Candidatus Eremiobacteraeota bacterium]|nr:HAMP domain-containing histidine kinase [Candidatus Eremiobacteraeota bacterium]